MDSLTENLQHTQRKATTTLLASLKSGRTILLISTAMAMWATMLSLSHTPTIIFPLIVALLTAYFGLIKITQMIKLSMNLKVFFWLAMFFPGTNVVALILLIIKTNQAIKTITQQPIDNIVKTKIEQSEHHPSSPKDNTTLSPTAFTQELMQRIKQAFPTHSLQVGQDFSIIIKDVTGRESKLDLTNAYQNYQQSPQAIERIMSERLSILRDQELSTPLNAKNIIPIIKNRQWITDAIAQAKQMGDKPMELTIEQFVGDLFIVYAEDRENSIRYLSPQSLRDAGIEPDNIRRAALNNLLQKIDIETHTGDLCGMIIAGGTYEASLLLLQNLWDDLSNELQGDIVVAVPTRDVVMYTSRTNQQGISSLKIAIDNARGQTYPISEQLFLYSQGHFQVFNG